MRRSKLNSNGEYGKPVAESHSAYRPPPKPVGYIRILFERLRNALIAAVIIAAPFAWTFHNIVVTGIIAWVVFILALSIQLVIGKRTSG